MSTEFFGSGHLGLDKIDLLTTPKEHQAEFFGDRLGCPSVPSIIEREGAEFMTKRYFQLVLYYGYVVEEIRDIRPDLVSQIENPIQRLPNEPLSTFDPEWIPIKNLTIIPGPETPAGYALPRLLLYYANESNNEKPSERMMRGLDYFHNTLEELKPEDDINSLLVKFAEKLTAVGVADKKQILRNTISAGKQKQDSFKTYFRDILLEMKNEAPTLYQTYLELSSLERTENKIANIVI